MKRGDVIAQVRAALALWREHGMPTLRRVYIHVADGRPAAAHLDLGIEPDCKGVAFVTAPAAGWFGRIRERFRPPPTVIYVFAGNVFDALDVRRVVWHELAHALGLDEDDVEALGLAGHE